MAVSSDGDHVLTCSPGLAGLLSGHQDSPCAGLGILAYLKHVRLLTLCPAGAGPVTECRVQAAFQL